MSEIPHSEKMFHLPIEVSVYVPSTQDVDKVISKSEMKLRVDEVKKYLATLFGGFSASSVEGGFLASDGKVVKENVERVVSFAPKEDFDKNKEALVQKASEWATKWGQEAIGLEHEGDLYYVPQKFENGGTIAIREAKEMANSQAIKIKHHVSELANILKSSPTIEAWVIAKLESASNDLADVTHYLDGKTQLSGKKMATGGQTPTQEEFVNRIPKNYELELDYKIGQNFQVDVLGGTTNAYIKSFDFSVDKVDGKATLNSNSYRIHYIVNGKEESSHYSFLKNLKKEKNKITLEVPYSLDGGIFFENSRYDGNLKLLNGKVKGFQIHYYGDTNFNNRLFTYYANTNGKNYIIDSKDAYSSLDNYVTRVSNNTYFQKDLLNFIVPKGGKIKTTLDYKVGQKIKIARMGGYEEAEIVAMEIDVYAKNGEVIKNSSDSIIKIKSENQDDPYDYSYKSFEEGIQEKRFVLNKIENEIEIDVKVLYSEKYLTISRYMGGSKLKMQSLSYYVLKIDKSNVEVGYVGSYSDDLNFDIFTSMDDFKKQITSNNFKNGGKMATGGNLSEKMIKVKVDYLEQQYFQLEKEMEIPFSEYKEYDKTGKVSRELIDDLISETSLAHHVETNAVSVRLTPITSDKMARGGQTQAQQNKIAKVMGEFKDRELHSSSGDLVTDRKQAIAIALSEAGVSKKMADGGKMEFERPSYKSSYVASQDQAQKAQAEANLIADENWNQDYENDPLVKGKKKAKETAIRAAMA